MRNLFAFVVLVFAAVSAVGCQQGFKNANDLESDERGPKACSSACEDLGMRMSAFVLVEHATSGCVCSPKAIVGSAEAEATAVAGGHLVIEEQRRAQEQQQRQAQATAR